ncbi:titin-like [Mercenaria mercenaria]|uniref:titin-like n=1 Tax=Mercenaria mercenaria TaxID=6596 RepID=UPI00234F75F5|nr:titin-like [Mercenaria mercenaria]
MYLTDLTFNIFQVLENGWWLGCKDKTVGWFPGTFVEMIDQPSASPSPSPASSNRSPSQSPVPSEDTQLLPDNISNNQQQSDVKPASQSKLKPVRKAPAPPTPKTPKSPESQVTDGHEPNVEKKPESRLPTPGGSRLPKLSRPKVAPPLPPTKHTPDHHDPLYDIIDKNDHINDVNKNISEKHVPNDINSDQTKQNGPTSDGLYELIRQPDNNSNDVSTPKRDKIKPPVPKRYIKPKLVTVPKTEVQMPNKDTLTKGLVNGDVMRLRSPPPPRPMAPKLGPIRAKLTEPKPLEDQIPSEEEDTFFNVTPQRKFDAFVCQDLNEQVAEEEAPYQSLSSFGSFGVSSFGKPKENKTLHQGGKPNNHQQKEDQINYDKSKPLNVQVNNEKVSKFGINEEAMPNDDRKTEIKSIEAKVNDVPNETTNEQKDLSVNNTAENQPKAKAGIPVTPKMKASRLAPPKPVSAKTSDTRIEADSDKTASSPEKPSKLQKPSKLVPSSKIPLSPNESPKKKVEDSDIFQYPDSSYCTGNSTKNTNSNDEHVQRNKPKSENAEQRQRTESVEKKPQSEVTENQQNMDGFENRQRTESLEKRPHNESVENTPKTDSVENRHRTDSLENRARTDSFGKPPVAPKPKSGLPKLAKPKTIIKSKEEPAEDTVHGKSPTGEDKSVVSSGKSPPNDGNSPAQVGKSRKNDVEIKPTASPITPETRTRLSESESDTDNKIVDDKTKSVTGSKLPLGSAKTNQSPKMRGRKSNIPSPGIRNKSLDRSDKTVSDRKLSESDNDGPMSPSVNLRQKPESPGSTRKAPSKQLGSVEKQSLRNRSNSPAGQSGIPTKMRNRSNSPAPKPAGIPVAVTNSPASKSTPKNKQRGLVPPKKILNGQDSPVDNKNLGSSKQPESPGLNSVMDDGNDPESDSTSPKPDRPSKPPRVQKQKSQDSKLPKHGKSLLPVIHKAMETGSGSPNGVSQTTPGTKPKRGIPVAKPARPAGPKTPPADQGEEIKRTLYQAVRGYTAEIDGELTFSEGTFVKELSDCDRPGWFVGMLADGTTGLYPADHFKPSPLSAQSEA